MATAGSSATPQWDTRNNGFIPPSQLNRLRQTSPLAREFGSYDRPLSMATNSLSSQSSSTLRPSVPTSSNHARSSSSSFFAFLKSNDNSPSTMPPRTAESDLQRQITTDEHGRVSLEKRQSPQLASSTLGRTPSLPALGQTPSTQLHAEIRSVVNLTHAHTHKVYMSGQLVRRVERLPDGNRPLKDEGWRDVWAQLGGTTLSIWDMKEIDEANKEGKEVPPIYINVTDAFVQVLGAVTIPASAGTPAQKYNNVVTLNTAGSNLILFSCPNAASLISWATALRLAAWEKARLEEIYTAHLIRITLNDGRNAPSALVRGRREGWVRIRIAGQTDWKHLWMIVVAGPSQETPGGPPRPGTPPSPQHRRRISSLFGRDNSQPQPPLTGPLVAFYLSMKPKDRKKPFLSLRDVTQAFAVYPERPELINKSTLMKIEGTIGDEEVAGARRKREGWILVMPELETGVPQANETIRWLTAFHDAFSLYGRPRAYSWDPRDQASMMYAYPVGPARDSLFLERETAEPLDPREYRTSAVRSRLLEILSLRLQIASSQSAASKSQSSHLSTITSLPSTEGPGKGAPQDGSLSLPPIPLLNIGLPGPESAMRRALTPIVEGSVSEKDPSRPFVSGMTITRLDNVTNDFSGPLPNEERREVPEVPNSAPISPPSVYTPTEGTSAPISPRHGQSEESLRKASMAKQSPANGVSLTDDGPSERPSVDDNRTNDVDRVSPTTSVRSLHSSAVSPPSLSPTNSSNPPASVSPVRVPPRTPSPKFSILTSPHSMTDTPSRPNQSFTELGAGLSPQSPVTPGLQATPLEPSKLSQDSIQTSTESSPDGIYDEAGALYYIQQLEPGSLDDGNPQPMPEGDDEDLNLRREFAHSLQIIQPTVAPLRPKTTSPHPPLSPGRSVPSIDTSHSHRKPPSQPLPRTPTLDYSPDRRPAGARAAPVSNRQDSVTSSHLSRNFSMPTQHASMSQSEDLGEDALAALTFVERHEDDAPIVPGPTHFVPPPVASSPSRIPQETPAIVEPDIRPQTPESENASVYKSSFAPSKNAMQRKARSEAQQAAHEAATHRPGHGTGKAKNKAKAVGAWGDSSEEEEEDEEDDEDVDSDGEPVAPRDDRSVSNYAASVNQRSRFSSPRGPSPLASGGDVPPAQPPPQARPPRNLPPVPIPRGQVHDGDAAGPRRLEPFEGAGRRSYYEDGVSHGGAAPQGSIPTHAPAPIAPRHMWSQVLDPGHTPGAVPENNNARETFIQLESPAQTMTKAFTPHGLLSVGLQDKEDRSAKRQEELARETGASLINVPSKPPPPQTGLLGAITAHERDRKREGGVGAALTEREREKRMAEERQRKLDELQRQQLEQMQQGGSLYGQPLPGYNPMMNPMMMGMNPMMNPFMGYPGMMPGFGNPQHMFAAQQAAQAYQQAMLSLSQAGSQIGGEGGMAGASPPPLNPMMTGGMGPTAPSPISPMMTGAGMGMGGFDPRFSMMGMPMMNPMAMGMGMGMGNPGMMGAPMGMGMPMNPGPGFDSRMSQFDPGLQVPNSNNFGQSGRPASNMGRDASPAPSEGARRSASASPRPLQ